jgi:RNA polymerase sigma-70 factor (ECF subfamily)
MPPAAEAQSADRGFDIQAALDALSEKLRIVVVMHIYHGFDYSEIAVALGIPLGTVKSRMHLALQQLEELFREQRQ